MVFKYERTRDVCRWREAWILCRLKMDRGGWQRRYPPAEASTLRQRLQRDVTHKSRKLPVSGLRQWQIAQIRTWPLTVPKQQAFPKVWQWGLRPTVWDPCCEWSSVSTSLIPQPKARIAKITDSIWAKRKWMRDCLILATHPNSRPSGGDDQEGFER